MLSQRDANELSIASDHIDLSNLPERFEKTSAKRETWCASQAMKSSANIDALKASAASFPPLPTEDGHAIMVAKEFELKAQIREMGQKFENREAEICTLRIQLDENSQRSAAALDEAISKAGDEFCDMEDSLNAQIEALTKERDDLFSTVSTLEAKVAEIDHALKSFNLDNEELRKSVENLSADKQVLNEEIGTLKGSITSLGQEKFDLAKTIDELTADLESTISKSGELEETLVLKIDHLESAMIESDEKHKNEIVELASQVKDFQERIASISNEKKILEDQLAEVGTTKCEITALEGSLSGAQATIQENNVKVQI
jgi:chromosome segregation ATPase